MSTPPAPDLMPYDVPYGPTITADQAAKIVAPWWGIAEVAAQLEDGDLGRRSERRPGLFLQDGSDPGRFGRDLASKARTAARFRRPSEAFFKVMQTPAGAYMATLDPTLVASPGGIPLIKEASHRRHRLQRRHRRAGSVACKAGADRVS